MIVRAILKSPSGAFTCSSCFTPLQREEKLIGFFGQTPHDVYRCTRCDLLHWSPRQSTPHSLAS